VALGGPSIRLTSRLPRVAASAIMPLVGKLAFYPTATVEILPDLDIAAERLDREPWRKSMGVGSKVAVCKTSIGEWFAGELISANPISVKVRFMLDGFPCIKNVNRCSPDLQPVDSLEKMRRRSENAAPPFVSPPTTARGPASPATKRILRKASTRIPGVMTMSALDDMKLDIKKVSDNSTRADSADFEPLEPDDEDDAASTGGISEASQQYVAQQDLSHDAADKVGQEAVDEVSDLVFTPSCIDACNFAVGMTASPWSRDAKQHVTAVFTDISGSVAQLAYYHDQKLHFRRINIECVKASAAVAAACR